MRGLVLLSLVGCGRIGFAPPSDQSDGATGDDEIVGELDPGFGTGGSTLVGSGPDGGHAFDVITRAGGYLTFGIQEVGGNNRAQLIGWTTSGVIDPGFGTVQYLDAVDEYGYSIAPVGDHYLLAGDGYNGATGDDMLFALVTSTGQLDPSFGTQMTGIEHRNFTSAASYDTALKVLVTARGFFFCGVTERNSGDSHNFVGRLRVDGAIDNSFGGGPREDDDGTGYDTCWDAVEDAAGNITTVGSGDDDVVVTRYTADGVRDASFATGGRYQRMFEAAGGEGYAIAFAPDGDIIIAGQDGRRGLVMRLAPDGTPRATFGSGGAVFIGGGGTASYVLYDVIVQPNGKIVAAGQRRESGTSDGVVVRLLADGSGDPGFGQTGEVRVDQSDTDELNTVLWEPGGLVTTGSAQTPDGVSRPWLVRLR